MTTPAFDINDDRLTAYALGELDGAGRAEVEGLLAASPELQTEFAELQSLATMLRSELAMESKPSLTTEQHQALLAAASPTLQPTSALPAAAARRRRIRRWAMIGAEVAVGAAVMVGILGYSFGPASSVNQESGVARNGKAKDFLESIRSEADSLRSELAQEVESRKGFSDFSQDGDFNQNGDLIHDGYSTLSMRGTRTSKAVDDAPVVDAFNLDVAELHLPFTPDLKVNVGAMNVAGLNIISKDLGSASGGPTATDRGRPNAEKPKSDPSMPGPKFLQESEGREKRRLIVNNDPQKTSESKPVTFESRNSSTVLKGDPGPVPRDALGDLSREDSGKRADGRSDGESKGNAGESNLALNENDSLLDRQKQRVRVQTEKLRNEVSKSVEELRQAGDPKVELGRLKQTLASVNSAADVAPEDRRRMEKLLKSEIALYEKDTNSAETYEAPPESAFLTPDLQPLSTFSIDVDSASYSNVRRFLTQGQLPPPDAVRIEEMVNYFSYDYPRPKEGEPFSVTADAAPCPWRREHYLARIALQARTIDKAKRPPTNLVFLLDVSGSMQAANKLPLVKQAMTMLVEELNERDRIAIVTYAGDAGVKLASTSGSEQVRIMQSIEALRAGGSTNGAAGISVAYEEALRHFNGEGENRVILCTDGDFNVGVSSDEQLVQLIQAQAKSKVFLSIFGFGMGNLKDAKLEKLADKGNGHYGYIDDLKEARRVFSDELTGTLYTVAKDVKIQVEFNPQTVGAYRLIGYENRALAARDFNDDTKDAGEIGAGHTVTALYEIVPRGQWPKTQAVDSLKYANATKEPAPAAEPAKSNLPPESADDLFTVKLRYKQPTADTSVKTIDYVVDDIAGKKIVPSADFVWAATVASFGMHLRHSQFAGQWTLEDVYETAKGALDGDVGGATVVPLKRLDPKAAAEAMRKLFAENGPAIEADVPGRRLLVRGTAEQLTQITQLLVVLGENGDTNGRRREFLDLVQAAIRLSPQSVREPKTP